MKRSTDRKRPRLVARFVAISWRDLAVSFGPILLISAAAIYLAVRLIQPAPPSTLTISAGPPGSSFWNAAQKYKDILARNGITLNVLPSQGSLDNLTQLADPHSKVDVGFVQDGVSTPRPPEGLVSLGSVAYVPLAIFYHGPTATRLSVFKGERLAIGTEGSGSRQLALALLKANGIEPGGTTKMLSLPADEAADDLVAGKVDAVFLTGDSAQPAMMGKLLRTPNIQFFDFTQADAYAKRFPYLTHIDLPMGAFDLGKNLPPQTLHMVAPTVELVARDSLHPALSDLLVEAAKEVHGKASLLQQAGEFPSPRTQDFPIGDDAARYYKSGKGFLYRTLPFWVASLADRLIVLLVPIIVVLIPGLRLVPSLYAWRVKSRIYRWYGALISIERSALGDTSGDERRSLLQRLDAIEDSVNALKMPLAYADQFYVLREHIGFVRARLLHERGGQEVDEPRDGIQSYDVDGDGTAAETPATADVKANTETEGDAAADHAPHPHADTGPASRAHDDSGNERAETSSSGSGSGSGRGSSSGSQS